MATILYAREEYVNATNEYRYGDSGVPQECYTNDTGRLYRSLAREFGRCTGKVYVDTESRGTIAVGWVFVKRCEYEGQRRRGTPETYLREVWVTLYERLDDDGQPFDDDNDYDLLDGCDDRGRPTFQYHKIGECK